MSDLRNTNVSRPTDSQSTLPSSQHQNDIGAVTVGNQYGYAGFDALAYSRFGSPCSVRLKLYFDQARITYQDRGTPSPDGFGHVRPHRGAVSRPLFKLVTLKENGVNAPNKWEAY